MDRKKHLPSMNVLRHGGRDVRAAAGAKTGIAETSLVLIVFTPCEVIQTPFDKSTHHTYTAQKNDNQKQ